MQKEYKKTKTVSRILAVIAIISFVISAIYIGQSFNLESQRYLFVDKQVVTVNKEENLGEEQIIQDINFKEEELTSMLISKFESSARKVGKSEFKTATSGFKNSLKISEYIGSPVYLSESLNKDYKIQAQNNYGFFEFTVLKNNKPTPFRRFSIKTPFPIAVGEVFWVSDNVFNLALKYEHLDSIQNKWSTGDTYYIQVDLGKDPRCLGHGGPIFCFYDIAEYLIDNTNSFYVDYVIPTVDRTEPLQKLPKPNKYLFKSFEFDADAFGYGIFDKDVEEIVFMHGFHFDRASAGFPIGITKENSFIYFFKTEQSEYVDNPYGPVVFYPTEVDLIEYDLLTGKKNILTTKTCLELKSYNQFKDIYCGEGEVSRIQSIENLYEEYNLNF